MKKGLIFGLCAILLTNCQVVSRQVKETSLMTATPKQYSVEEVEKIARIEIPAAASEIQVYAVTGWMDDAALIKFALPPTELKPFLEKYGFHNLERGYWSIQDFGISWWPTEGAIANYIGETLNFPELGYTQSILIDITNPNLYVVYFQYFET
ncbi:MAG: hypothetical protein ACK8QZ_10935 [Anaerolineales bacterium]